MLAVGELMRFGGRVVRFLQNPFELNSQRGGYLSELTEILREIPRDNKEHFTRFTIAFIETSRPHNRRKDRFDSFPIADVAAVGFDLLTSDKCKLCDQSEHLNIGPRPVTTSRYHENAIDIGSLDWYCQTHYPKLRDR